MTDTKRLTKRLTVRFKSDEIDMADELAAEKGTIRAVVIRSALSVAPKLLGTKHMPLVEPLREGRPPGSGE